MQCEGRSPSAELLDGMHTTFKKFVAVFVIASAVVFCVNLVPFIRTFRAYQGDGFEVIGFPFIFRRIGGEPPGVYEFHASALQLDILIGLAAALFAAFIFTLWFRPARKKDVA